MAANTKVLITITIFLSLVYKSSAIYCYYCNSANNSACIAPLDYDDQTRVRLIPVINCEASIPVIDPNLHFFCRKIVQTIYLPHQNSELRITRGCGWVPHEKKCYRNDHANHLETACQCFNDFCNSADNVEPVSATILFVMLSACLYFYREM